MSDYDDDNELIRQRRAELEALLEQGLRHAANEAHALLVVANIVALEAVDLAVGVDAGKTASLPPCPVVVGLIDYLTSTILASQRQLFWPVDGSCR